MKFKILSLLIILGILAAVPMIYMGKFDPLAFFDAGHKLDLGGSGADEKGIENLSTVVTDEKVQVYRWRDQNGVMQFSNAPPPSVTGAEQIVLDPNSNIIQAVKVVEKEAPKAAAKIEAPNPYSINGMKKVMDDAKGIEALLQNRHEGQQKLMDGL